jgi:putative tryptophan/tyrosine transport system substrate-binding protein
MIRRREFIALLGGVAMAWPLAARAQMTKRIWRLGMLETTALNTNTVNFNSLRRALSEFGYIDGDNLIIEYRSADGVSERFTDLAAELVHLQVDLIVTRGTPATLAAENAPGTTPVVAVALSRPLAVVANLARPTGKVTGLASLASELAGKRMEILKEMVPHITRIAMMFNSQNPTLAHMQQELEAAARTLGLQHELVDVRRREDIEPAFEFASRHADAMLVGIETVTQANRALIAELAVKYRLPAIYAAREYIQAGGLVSFGVSYPDLYRRVATYVDKIFKGAKPVDLPIEQPTKFELIINLPAARAINLSIPESFLARADEVIE